MTQHTSTGGSSRTTVADWFESALTFRRLCMFAQHQASSEKDMEFTASMLQKAERFGLRTFVSSGQIAWLCRLAQQDIPKRRPTTLDLSPR